MRTNRLNIFGVWLVLALVLAACAPEIEQAPTVDVQAQIATVVAATQAALPPAEPTPLPALPTATTGPQQMIVQLAPDLQTILALPESSLTLYALGDDGQVYNQQDILGGAEVMQWEMSLLPGFYRFVGVYSPMEGFDLLGQWAADGGAQRVEVSAATPVQTVVLTRPAAPCVTGAQQIAEQIGLGAGYAQINSCSTGKLIVSFDASVTSPPPAAVYATSEGMFTNTIMQDVASAVPGTNFILSVPPGDYYVSARSMLASDVSFFGVWGASGLALVHVEHNGSTSAYLTKPGDPCVAMYQLSATPDGRFPETNAYQTQFHCGESGSSGSSGGSNDTMGPYVLGRAADGVETFADASYWYEYEDDKYVFSVIDGKMVMVGKDPGLNDAWVTAPIKLKDFYIEATFKMGDSCSDKDRYGLLVRAPDPAYGYVVSFTCGGMFRMYYMDGDKYKAVQEWKASDLIETGASTTNRVGVWAKGNQIRLYANGKLLGSYTDDKFTEGIIGVHIGAVSTDNLLVRVDEIQWWDLSK